MVAYTIHTSILALPVFSTLTGKCQQCCSNIDICNSKAIRKQEPAPSRGKADIFRRGQWRGTAEKSPQHGNHPSLTNGYTGGLLPVNHAEVVVSKSFSPLLYFLLYFKYLLVLVYWSDGKHMRAGSITSSGGYRTLAHYEDKNQGASSETRS